jgi:hypothetical protein
MISWIRYEYKGQFIDCYDRFNTTPEILAYFEEHNIPESEFSKVKFSTQMVTDSLRRRG